MTVADVAELHKVRAELTALREDQELLQSI